MRSDFEQTTHQTHWYEKSGSSFGSKAWVSLELQCTLTPMVGKAAAVLVQGAGMIQHKTARLLTFC